MKKNVASQSVGAQMVTAADGTAFTGTVTVVITIDNGTQTASAGTAPAHEGNGYHSYTPTQAETNGDHLGFTFTGTGAIPATVQMFTEFPQTADHTSAIADVPNNSEFNARTLVNSGYASPTNITAGTLTTVTNLTNLPSIPNNWLTSSGIAASALNGKGNWNIGKSGYSISGLITTLDGLNDFNPGFDEVTLDATSIDLIWDEPLTGATHNVPTSAGRRLRGLQDFGNYLGSVHIDTVNGVPGTVIDENGTVENPVSTLADAIILNTTLNYNRFRIRTGSIINLSQAFPNYVFFSDGSWTLTLNGQDISDSTFRAAEVSGIALGTGMQRFEGCIMGACTLPAGTRVAKGCGITGIQTLPLGDIFYDNWHSEFAGAASTAIFDFGTTLGNTNLNLRHSSGGAEFRNMGQLGVDTCSLEGEGQYILNANCIGGSLAVRGHFDKTDNAGGVVTVIETARYDQQQIANAVWDEILTGATHNITNSAGKRVRQVIDSVVIFADNAQSSAGIGPNQVKLSVNASSTDGAYDPANVTILEGTGRGQTRLIIEYDGTTKIATVDRNWKMQPDVTSVTSITANSGREHVNEGLAQTGTVNTITLNSLASPVDNAYKNQTVFIRSGTGEDQARIVLSYDGTTKIAIVDKDWDVIPDNLTGYVMLPRPVRGTDDIAKAILETQMTESYSADGDAPTLTEAVLLIQQMLGDFLIAGTTLIIKKIDGVTTAATFTLNDDTDPSGSSRTT